MTKKKSYMESDSDSNFSFDWNSESESSFSLADTSDSDSEYDYRPVVSTLKDAPANLPARFREDKARPAQKIQKQKADAATKREVEEILDKVFDDAILAAVKRDEAATNMQVLYRRQVDKKRNVGSEYSFGGEEQISPILSKSPSYKDPNWYDAGEGIDELRELLSTPSIDRSVRIEDNTASPAELRELLQSSTKEVEENDEEMLPRKTTFPALDKETVHILRQILATSTFQEKGLLNINRGIDLNKSVLGERNEHDLEYWGISNASTLSNTLYPIAEDLDSDTIIYATIDSEILYWYHIALVLQQLPERNVDVVFLCNGGSMFRVSGQRMYEDYNVEGVIRDLSIFLDNNNKSVEMLLNELSEGKGAFKVNYISPTDEESPQVNFENRDIDFFKEDASSRAAKTMERMIKNIVKYSAGVIDNYRPDFVLYLFMKELSINAVKLAMQTHGAIGFVPEELFEHRENQTKLYDNLIAVKKSVGLETYLNFLYLASSERMANTIQPFYNLARKLILDKDKMLNSPDEKELCDTMMTEEDETSPDDKHFYLGSVIHLVNILVLCPDQSKRIIDRVLDEAKTSGENENTWAAKHDGLVRESALLAFLSVIKPWAETMSYKSKVTWPPDIEDDLVLHSLTAAFCAYVFADKLVYTELEIGLRTLCVSTPILDRRRAQIKTGGYMISYLDDIALAFNNQLIALKLRSLEPDDLEDMIREFQEIVPDSESSSPDQDDAPLSPPRPTRDLRLQEQTLRRSSRILRSQVSKTRSGKVYGTTVRNLFGASSGSFSFVQFLSSSFSLF